MNDGGVNKDDQEDSSSSEKDLHRPKITQQVFPHLTVSMPKQKR